MSSVTLESEKGTTPARRAMSASPNCQCIASAARHGIAISSATLAHISGLNLKARKSVRFPSKKLYRKYKSLLPLIKSCQFVLSLLVPLASALQVVLVMQATANGTASRQSPGNILPLHSPSPQINDQCILVRRPLALLLGRRLGWVRRHTAFSRGVEDAAAAVAGKSIGGQLLP